MIQISVALTILCYLIQDASGLQVSLSQLRSKAYRLQDSIFYSLFDNE